MSTDSQPSQPSMRIALVGPATSVHLRQWAAHLADAGHDVHLCSVHPWIGPDPQRFVVHRLPGSTPFGYLVGARRLRRLMRQLRPDVLHAHYATGYGLLARLAGYRPLVVSVWGSDVFDFPTRSRLHRWFLLMNLRAAQRICSTSEVMARQLRSLGIDGSVVSVVPFGVDVDRFAPDGRLAGPLTVGTVKTLTTTYGIDLLIEAFAVAVAHLRDLDSELADRAHLVIVGDGELRLELEQLAARLGVSDVTRFLGAVPHEAVPGLLQTFDVFAALSRRESFGVSVLEASAAGLPVVAAEIGGLVEVVEDGVTGILVPAGDISRAAEALLRLMVDAPLRARLGGAGAEMVRERFAWPRCVALQVAAYASVADPRSNLLDGSGAL